MSSFRRQIIPIMAGVVSLFLLGTLGYILIEGWSLLDAVYMTVITLTTIGFAETRPLSAGGRVFTIVLIFLGVSAVAYSLKTLGEFFFTANLGQRLQRRRMMQNVRRMNDHVIVCGYGRVGMTAAHSLRSVRQGVLVVEQQPERAEAARQDDLWVLEGDATRDEVLRDAGIDRAWGLIVATGHDGDNLLIVLSARTLNAKLYIVARSTSADNESKMRRAGADRVVSPYQMGGRHMANLMIRPHITEFLDVVTLDGGVELWLEELTIAPQSDLVGQTVVEANIRRRTGVVLVALRRGETGAMYVPDENTRLAAADELMVLGTREQLAHLEKLTGPQTIRRIRSR